MTETPARAVLVGVQLPEVTDAAFKASLDELERLAETLGYEVIGRVTQARAGLSRAAVIGRGKLQELARYTGGSGEVPKHTAPTQKKDLDEEEEEQEPQEEGAPDAPLPEEQRAHVVILDHDVSPSQAKNLQAAAGVTVLDRTAVILEIFWRHAKTRAARLEVEIARLSYLTPRLREGVGRRERQGGGIGGRGAGESAAELDKRKVRDRIAQLRKELEAIAEQERKQRARRSLQNVVALVGYTNAGKSSLMRRLCGQEVYVADKLFATLGITVRALEPPTTPPILVTDTVGFIKDLPHELVASFRATLESARDADFLLHLIDASDPDHDKQVEVTRTILDELEIPPQRILRVFNKMDRVSPEDAAVLAERHPDAFFMSTKVDGDITRVRAAVVEAFERHMSRDTFFVPYARHALVAELHATCRVLDEQHEDEGTRITVLGLPQALAPVRAALERVDAKLG